MTEEEKIRLREQSRIRQQKYNERKKRKLEEEVDDNPSVPKKAKKALTRREHQKLKDYWREKKRQQRASMSSQKKRRVREKERARYASRKLAKTLSVSATPIVESPTSTLMPSTPVPSTSFELSSSSIKQRAYRAKKGMPKSPEKFAHVVGHLIKNASPRKKLSLRNIGIYNSPKKTKENYSKSILETMAAIKHKRQESWLSVKRCLISSMRSTKKATSFLNMKTMSEDTGLSYRFLKKYTSCDVSDLTELQRKKRRDCIQEDIREKVLDHFEESASFVPDKKAVSRKTLESKKVLEKPVTKVYEDFKQKNPDIKISKSKFAKLRPSYVKTTYHRKLYQSMCEYCTNTRLKMEAMNRACEKVGAIHCKVDDIYKLIELSVCPKQEGEDYHQKECLTRECVDCGVELLDALYEEATAPNAEAEQEITWRYWSNAQYCQPGKRPSTRKTLLTKTTSLVDLRDALKEDVHTLSSHLLNAYWQKNCFQAISKKVPEKGVVLHMDFSENYSTFYQQEVSSAHWVKNLVTVHPTVAFYTCPECGDAAHPVMDTLVFLSEDHNHDHHAVQTFVEETIRFLKEERHVDFNHLYEFTDGCSSQYKSRGPFVDISFGMTDFGIQRQRYYFGSCHGKGPCDGAGGVVKTAARRGVIRGEAIINDAQTMYNYLKTKLTRTAKVENICNHSRREFFLVEINRDRPDRTIKTSVKGTRKVHCIRGVMPGVVETRNLGCVCSYCLSEEWDTCTKFAYVDTWSTHELQLLGREAGRGRRGQAVGRGQSRARTRGGARLRGRGVGRGQSRSRTPGGARLRARGTNRRGRGVRVRGGRRGGIDIDTSSSSEGEFIYFLFIVLVFLSSTTSKLTDCSSVLRIGI